MQAQYNQLVEEQRDLFFQNTSCGKSEEEIRQIRAAYELASVAHLPQTRESGEPYILHPIAVARIIGEVLKLGANTIIAALLHDVAEDTPYTIDYIRKHFGNDVAFLVQAVTKKKKGKYEMSKQLDNFRQMLDSIHYDIRALLIKLADRLHNMRTLSSMETVTQMKIAGETDCFFAPLANRLGLYDIKSELENLSLQYRSPREYQLLNDSINNYMSRHQDQINLLTETINTCLSAHNIRATVKVKVREPYSIRRKMEHQKVSFDTLEHIYVIHIIFSDHPDSQLSEKNQILQIYSLLTDVFNERPLSLVNYIDTPKINGYQCLHCEVMGFDGQWVEIHIASEQMAFNNSFGCITGRKNGVEKWVEKFRKTLKDIAEHGIRSGFLEDVVSALYMDNIVVYTPRGDEIFLPKNASALDFAYELHTDLGNRAKYARINGKLCSVKTILKRGDRVEIGMDASVGPHQDWLDHVITYKAQKNILTELTKAKDRCEPFPYLLCEHCQPLPGEEIIGFRNGSSLVEVHKRNCPSAILLSAKAGDTIVDVTLPVSKEVCYPAIVSMTAIDRNELLFDLTQVISKELGLYIHSIHSTAMDEIVTCTLHLYVSSSGELSSVINRLKQIDGIDEIRQDEETRDERR